ncbi:hypothetical protein LCGC14_1781760, partial [marine sediment metagenome]
MSIPVFKYNAFRHRSVEFACKLWKKEISSINNSGSVEFGIEDTTTNQVAGSSILYSPTLTPLGVSGSLDLTGLGLTTGRLYR